MRDNFIRRALAAIDESSNERLDSNETMFLERELTQLRAKTYDVEYAPLIGRQLVPIANDIAPSADKYAYKVYDRSGKAKVIANASDDPPNIEATAKEVTGKVYTVGDSYKWSIMELREAARTRTPLSEKKAAAARDAIEVAIDEMLFEGVPADVFQTNLVTTGLFNNADVVSQTVASLTDWVDGTSVDTILGEINGMFTSVFAGSRQRWAADTLVLPSDRYAFIAQRKLGTNNDTTVLKFFLANNPFVKAVLPWHRLDTYGTNGNGRALVFRKDPIVLEGVVPQEFEQLPPQARNFEFVVPCQARCGGVMVYQPSAMKYGDFAA
jgi:hypothetical protein